MSASAAPAPVIVIHGGAGVIASEVTPERELLQFVRMILSRREQGGQAR